MKRMWVNQPSTLQRRHKYHGRRILYDTENGIGYFLKGDLESLFFSPLEVSEGWKAYPLGSLTD